MLNTTWGLLPVLMAHPDSGSPLVATERGVLGFVLEVREETVLALALVLLFLVPLAIFSARRFGRQQRRLRESVQQHANALELARAKLAHLVQTGIRLGSEPDREALFDHVLSGARDVAHCQVATLFIKTEQQMLRIAVRTNKDSPLPVTELPLFDDAGEPVKRYVSTYVAHTGESVVIDDVYAETRFDLTGTKQFSEQSGFRTISMLTVALSPREGEIIGVLQLLNCEHPDTGEVVPFDGDTVEFMEALAAQAAVALENQNLLAAQKELMDSMIRVIAGAIDTKSAYTGGHCERVPELALMLVDAAERETEGPLADFRFHTEDERREFRIGAWLHDCGKVTTPEFVVDKATKLETIYNRIHEVRTRFEVLLRDAAIERLEAIHERGEPREVADARFADRKTRLMDDFRFVAACNLGSEHMDEADRERVQRIARQRWLRHFDNRLGLAHDERRRFEATPAPELPVWEPLLADQPHHRIAWPGGVVPATGERFNLRPREHLYDQGEVYNLGIPYGTLTPEERFKINEHIIQTILMLEQLPFPAHLRRVPEYAGTHHETLTGTGYPLGLAAAELSVPARIMAIADIFEALTASDRPYKGLKTLSESVRLLARFRDNGHIDPVLFRLFLTSGVYRVYAERFLLPEQIDEVDIAPYLS